MVVVGGTYIQEGGGIRVQEGRGGAHMYITMCGPPTTHTLPPAPHTPCPCPTLPIAPHTCTPPLPDAAHVQRDFCAGNKEELKSRRPRPPLCPPHLRRPPPPGTVVSALFVVMLPAISLSPRRASGLRAAPPASLQGSVRAPRGATAAGWPGPIFMCCAVAVARGGPMLHGCVVRGGACRGRRWGGGGGTSDTVRGGVHAGGAHVRWHAGGAHKVARREGVGKVACRGGTLKVAYRGGIRKVAHN